MIRLKTETRISYRCSPSERRAKTTDPGHAPCRQTRQQRRLLGNRPTVPGFFDFDPTWELVPSSKPPPPPNWKEGKGPKTPSTHRGLRVDREHTRVILEAGTLRQGQGAETKNLTKIIKNKTKRLRFT